MPRLLIEVKGLEGVFSVELERYPDRCPRCHKHIIGLFRSAYSRRESDKIVDAVFQCPGLGCGRTFIAEYNSFNSPAVLTNLVPITVEEEVFSDEIVNVSRNFVVIYNEALKAESLGLMLIAGPGYGKALEFLVKDYAIKHNPDDIEDIKKAFLGACIKNYISDFRVKSLAEKAAWLRNDESHYIKRWEKQDINDLKVLLKLVVNAIENHELYDKYQAEMS